MIPGKFIVVEGLEGAGKSTAIATVTRWLEQKQLSPKGFELTREPGGTPMAEALRTLVKQPAANEAVTDEAELMLMYASRVQLVANRIKPALAEGRWVIGDRHDMSSRAYQGGGRQLSEQLIDGLRELVLGDFRPDLVLYLDIDPETGLSRARQRGELDRIEQEAFSFFERTRDKYREIASTEANVRTIDARQPLEQVQQAIIDQLDAWWAQLSQQGQQDQLDASA